MTKRTLIVIGTTLLVLASACSSSDDPPANGASSTSGGSSSSSGGSSSGIKECPPENSGSSCPQAEIDAYAKCATDNCDAEYKECYGAGYASGSFGGPCGTQISCANKCDCDDSSCRQTCVPDAACNSCSQKLGQCIVGKCKLPCQGDQKTCADLEACCGKITDATKKSQCEAQAGALKAAGDTACNAVYAGFANDCK